MKISVIIPVYNAERYVERAVESALIQKECGEVILVEDNSPDNALDVCIKLANMHKNVLLYQHEDGINKGPGASRNLGVLKSKYDYIAFLDADDIYLENRFEKAVQILFDNQSLDGVYEPVDCTFENEEARRRYFETHEDEVAMVQKAVPPEKLYEVLISGKYGYIHPNGLLMKKECFFEVGMYPELRLHEDTVFHFKLALKFNLAAGETQRSVSSRLLHMENVITRPGNDFLQSRFTSYEYLIEWMKKNCIENKKIRMARIKYLQFGYRLLKKQGRLFKATAYYIMLKLLQKMSEKDAF